MPGSKKKKPAVAAKASKTAKAAKSTTKSKSVKTSSAKAPAKKAAPKKTGKVVKKAAAPVVKKKDKVAKKETKVSKKVAATSTKKEVTKKSKPAPVVVEKKAAKAPAPEKAKAPAKKAATAKQVVAPEAKVITDSLAKAAVEAKPKISEVLLTDAEGRVLCRFTGCDSPSVVESYCRYHYLLNWKKIQLRKKILAEGKLENYINELTARYPDKYVDMMKGDLKTEKDFLSAVQELEIDDPDAAMSDSDAENYLEEVRGIRGDNRGSSEDDY